MKITIPLVMMLAMTLSLFSQQTKPSPTLTTSDYLQKSKNQKTAAWVLFGAGAGLTSAGALWSISEVFYSGKNNVPQKVLLITGAMAMAGSISLFIASGKNKRKAMNISFKIQRSPQLLQSSLACQNIPAVSVKIGL